MVNLMNALMDILTIIPYELSVFVLFVIVFGFFGALFYIYKSAFKLMTKMAVVAIIALIFLLAGIYYVFKVEPNTILVKKSYIDVGADHPMKIVFISDIHVWSVSEEYLNRVITMTNKENPDYILLGGDYITGSENEISKLSFLQKLKSKKGMFAVMGNHDYLQWNEEGCPDTYGNGVGKNVSSTLENMGIHVLRNEFAELSNSTVLVGLDDYWACKTEYSKAVNNTENYTTRIALTHNQDAIPSKKLTDWDLVLAGHTHCGQVRLPLIGSLPKALWGFSGEYEMGYYKLGKNTHMYSTCGLGVSPRFMAPPEITVIELS